MDRDTGKMSMNVLIVHLFCSPFSATYGMVVQLKFDSATKLNDLSYKNIYFLMLIVAMDIKHKKINF